MVCIRYSDTYDHQMGLFYDFVKKVDSGELYPHVRIRNQLMRLRDEKNGFASISEPNIKTDPMSEVVRYRTAEYMSMTAGNVSFSEKYDRARHHSSSLSRLKCQIEDRLKREIETEIMKVYPPRNAHRCRINVNVSGRNIFVELTHRSNHFYTLVFDVTTLDPTTPKITI